MASEESSEGEGASSEDRAEVSPSLGGIAGVFARYANLTFGGGSATIAVLREQIIERRGWISETYFQLAYGLSRLTPGTNLLAFCTAVGWRLRNWRGALVALVAASLPCSIMAAIVTHFYELLQTNAFFGAALRGALAAAVAVMVNTAWILAAPHVKTAPVRSVTIIPAAILLAAQAPVSPIQVLLGAAVVGLAWPPRASKT